EQKSVFKGNVTREQTSGCRESKVPGIDWSRQLETERLAAQPHLLYTQQWQQNQILKRKLGPGLYEIKDFIQLANEKPRSERRLCGNQAPRFVKNTKGSGLGPGTYNLHTRYLPQRNKIEKPSHIGPGQYNFRTFVDDLHGPHRKYRGRFGKLAQYPDVPIDSIFSDSKTKNSLGPGAYYIKELSKPASTNSPAFLSSSRRDDKMAQKFFTRNFNPVGPGRYDIQKFEEAQNVNGHSSVFKSNTGKLSQQVSKVLQERIQGNSTKAETIFPYLQTGPSRSITVM
ncbi:unnamed protein product, partial [Candidula unifasciata]